MHNQFFSRLKQMRMIQINFQGFVEKFSRVIDIEFSTEYRNLNKFFVRFVEERDFLRLETGKWANF